ncbi:MAG: 50S ribosomal protein L30e [Promethearchaeota archaeon]|nr:MAG: 50S ribosomal protein L30e [Candidatus Lokiarchaeota archaeon]
MARKKKTEELDLSRKKKKVFDIDINIKVALKTGEIVYGKNQVLKNLRKNPFKMIIVANNCPYDLMSELEHYNSLLENKIYIHKYKGSSWDLGLACAEAYMISILGIYDFGDSDLQSLKSKGN